MGAVSLIFAALLVWWVISINDWNHRYSEWAAKCVRDGGVVMVYEETFWNTQHECIRDGKIINHIN